MSIYYPNVLWALLLIAIPIVIHLFNLRKNQIRYFSNLSFIRNVELSSKKKTKLKNIVILAMRIASIGFLVLAFSIPYIEKQSGGPTQNSILYIDNSYSMTKKLDEQTILDRVKIAALNYVDNMDASSSISILTNNMAEWGDEVSKYDAQKVIKSISASKKNVETVNSLILNKKTNSILISNWNKNGIYGLDDIKNDSTGKYELYVVEIDDASNIWIDSIWINSKFLENKRDFSLYVSICNSINSKIEIVALKLVSEQKLLFAQELKLQPGECRQVAIDMDAFNFSHQFEIQIDDPLFTFDNTFYFTVPEIRKQKVSIGIENDFIKKVFENDVFFKVQDGYSIDEYTSMDVIVDDESFLLKRRYEPLLRNNKSTNAKTVILFPSDNIDQNLSIVTDYVTFNTLKKHDSSFSQLDVSDVFFEDILASTRENIEMPKALPLFSLKGAKVILKGIDSTPLLSRINIGDLNVYMFHFPISNRFTNLHTHWAFLPIIYKLVLFESKMNFDRLYYTPSDEIIEVGIPLAKEQSLLIRSEKMSFIPAFTRYADGLSFDMRNNFNITPGNYSILIGDSIVHWFSLNHQNSESRLDLYTKDQLDSMFKESDHIRIKSFDSFESEIAQTNLNGSDRVFWKECLMMALLFLLTEIILLRYWK